MDIRSLCSVDRVDGGGIDRSGDENNRAAVHGSIPNAQAHQNRGHQFASTEVRDHAFVVQGDIIYNTNFGESSARKIGGYGATDVLDAAHKSTGLRNSLDFPRMNVRLLAIEEALVETGKWFLGLDEYLDWRDDALLQLHHGFMWIKGKPGCGKSTIMKLLYENSLLGNAFHRSEAFAREIVVSCFFNGRAPTVLEKSSIGLYRSLAHQIVSQVQEIERLFCITFESKEKRGNVEEWTENELKGFLLEALSVPAWKISWVIFIDALDEGSENDVRRMIVFMEKLATHALARGSRVRICLSSRHYPHISIRKGLQVVLENKSEHNDDIVLYVNHTLDSELSSLKDDICHKSEGVFLWVVLVVQMLNVENDEGGDIETARQMLQSLPPDLTDLFKDIMSKSDKGLEDCVSLFLWVLYANQALTAKDLYVAIHYSRGNSPPRKQFPPDLDRLHRFLLHRSRGLVNTSSVVEVGVQFIHETVRTFLLGEFGLPTLNPDLQDNFEGKAHELLKNACFLFIKHNEKAYSPIAPRSPESHIAAYGASHGSIESEQPVLPSIRRTTEQSFWPGFLDRPFVLDNAPFEQYAINNLMCHMETARSHGIAQDDFLRELRKFLLPDEPVLQHTVPISYEEISARLSDMQAHGFKVTSDTLVSLPYHCARTLKDQFASLKPLEWIDLAGDSVQTVPFEVIFPQQGAYQRNQTNIFPFGDLHRIISELDDIRPNGLVRVGTRVLKFVAGQTTFRWENRFNNSRSDRGDEVVSPHTNIRSSN